MCLRNSGLSLEGATLPKVQVVATFWPTAYRSGQVHHRRAGRYLTDIPGVVVARHALVGPPLAHPRQLLVPDLLLRSVLPAPPHHLPHIQGPRLTLHLPVGDALPCPVVLLEDDLQKASSVRSLLTTCLFMQLRPPLPT